MFPWPPRYKPNFEAGVRDLKNISSSKESKIYAIDTLKDVIGDKEKEEEAKKLLIDLIDSPDPDIRYKAIEALDNFELNQEELTRIKERIKDPQEDISEVSFYVVGKRGIFSLEELKGLVKDAKGRMIRYLALQFFMEFYGKSDLEFILQLLKEGDKATQQIIVEYVDKVFEDECKEKVALALYNIINEAKEVTPLEVKAAIKLVTIGGIRNVNSERVVEALKKGLEIEETQYEVVLVIGSYNLKQFVPILKKMLNSFWISKEIKAVLAGALCALDEPQGEKLLKRWLSSRLFFLNRLSAIVAIGQFRLKKFVNKLFLLITEEKSPSIITTAMEVLALLVSKEEIINFISTLPKEKKAIIKGYLNELGEEELEGVWWNLTKYEIEQIISLKTTINLLLD